MWAMSDRDRVAAAAAGKLGAAKEIPAAVVGFDGFIDEIIDVVDQRRDMTPRGYERIRTISEYAARVGAAAGKSSNLEMVVKEVRWGGNGPLMAGGLASLGSGVTYIGSVGEGPDSKALDSRYAELAKRCRKVIPIAPPAHTDALEFEDGKIMLGKPGNVQIPTWARLVDVVGIETLVEIVDSAGLVGMVNWVMMGGVEGIWEGLIDSVLPRLSKNANRRVFIDLADPAKRTDEDVRRAMGILKRMNALIPVTLGLNQAEAERMASVFGVGVFREEQHRTMGVAVQAAAVALREAMGLACVVVHPREGAGAALLSDRGVEAAWFEGPFTPTPRLSTGAGDHFNAGFALGLMLGMSVEESLAIGCGTSGAYVRDAQSPTRERLVEFLRSLSSA